MQNTGTLAALQNEAAAFQAISQKSGSQLLAFLEAYEDKNPDHIRLAILTLSSRIRALWPDNDPPPAIIPSLTKVESGLNTLLSNVEEVSADNLHILRELREELEIMGVIEESSWAMRP